MDLRSSSLWSSVLQKEVSESLLGDADGTVLFILVVSGK